MNAACITAHADDELLFAGALIDRYPDWTWTLVCMTRNAQSDRFPGLMLGHLDEWRILTNAEYEAWKADLAGQNLKPDVVFTHNRLGEYGHPHHMAVHAMVHELFPKVWDFYVKAPSSVGPQERDRTLISLPTEGKRERFTERYGESVLQTLTAHQPELIDAVFEREYFTGRDGWPT